ncbi:hypothetical protein PMIN04_008029 [Paraphaeosphaeria minitans]
MEHSTLSCEHDQRIRWVNVSLASTNNNTLNRGPLNRGPLNRGTVAGTAVKLRSTRPGLRLHVGGCPSPPICGVTLYGGMETD